MTVVASEALLLRSVPYGEADLMLTFLTEGFGKLTASFRGGRRSRRRAGGALEPFHTLHVAFDESGQDVARLREARIEKIRAALVSSLDAVDVGGRGLRWVRHLVPGRSPDPLVWRLLVGFLDDLEAGHLPSAVLATMGIELLGHVGYGLHLDSCVGCGRIYVPPKPAFFDPRKGGIVCRRCGGGPMVLSKEVMARLHDLQRGGGDLGNADPESAKVLLDVIESTMMHHADYASSHG